MPFTKVKSGKHKGQYKSPAGKLYSPRQVRAYYATHGFQRKPRKGGRKK